MSCWRDSPRGCEKESSKSRLFFVVLWDFVVACNTRGHTMGSAQLNLNASFVNINSVNRLNKTVCFCIISFNPFAFGIFQSIQHFSPYVIISLSRAISQYVNASMYGLSLCPGKWWVVIAEFSLQGWSSERWWNELIVPPESRIELESERAEAREEERDADAFDVGRLGLLLQALKWDWVLNKQEMCNT